MIIVVMGISASGKSTLGSALAESMGWVFLEGDDYHPKANIEKMRSGTPLEDGDRLPWLRAINRELRQLDAAGSDAVVACSALKSRYREILADGIEQLRYVYLYGNPDLIRQRIASRKGHFMPPELIDSQIAAMEPPHNALKVNIELPVASQAAEVLQAMELCCMHEYQAEPIAGGLAFPEGPRWHDNHFWFTDQHDASVYQLSPAGALTRYATTEDRPGGLGWLPDGSLLVVYMTRRKLMRRSQDRWVEYADLSSLASFHCNDIVVDSRGVVFAGNFGEPIKPGQPMGPAELIRIDTNGQAQVVSNDLVFPNGSAISEDGTELIIAETFAHRISRFDLDSDSQLSNHRIWAELGDVTPDGICLDAEGALWVASPFTHEVLRLAEGGERLASCRTQGTPYACMLGGDDRRTLYICTSESDEPEEAARIKSGRIESVQVDVPGCGLP